MLLKFWILVKTQYLSTIFNNHELNNSNFLLSNEK